MATKSKTRFAILGLLSWKPMSGYDIKKMIEMGLAHFWGESYGQLYPTLKQLVVDGLATVDELPRGNRTRKVYSLTDAGRVVFLRWLAEPTDPPRIRNEFQLKFFLSSNLPPNRAVELLKTYQSQQQSLQAMYRESELILENAVKNEGSVEEVEAVLGPSSKQQMLFFYLSLRHGVLAVEARIAWCAESVEAVQNYSGILTDA